MVVSAKRRAGFCHIYDEGSQIVRWAATTHSATCTANHISHFILALGPPLCTPAVRITGVWLRLHPTFQVRAVSLLLSSFSQSHRSTIFCLQHHPGQASGHPPTL